jgi:curved DNA-binding protein CbpA
MRRNVTLYDTLGIERDATDQEIRQAFRKLALKYHPDRFEGQQRAKAEEQFQEITEAFNVLSHPDSRDRYDKETSSGSDINQMDLKEISRRLAAKGTQSMRAGDSADAIQHLKAAIDHDEENARAHFFYAQVLGKIPSKKKDALRHAERAAQLEPNNGTMKAEAASAALANGMKSRAERFAREALSLDPTNIKATEVLAEIDVQEKKGGGGLLDRLRGRS